MNGTQVELHRSIGRIMDELAIARNRLETDEEFSPHITRALDMLETLALDI